MLSNDQTSSAIEDIIECAPIECAGGFEAKLTVVNKVAKVRVTLKEHSGKSQVEEVIA